MTPSPSTQQFYNDGQIQYGSIGPQVFKYSTTPGSTAASAYASTRGTFLVEDFTVSRPSMHKMVPDEIGGDRGQYAVKKNPTATAVLQYNDSSQGNPQQGDVFNFTAEPEIGAEYWVIISLSRAYKPSDYWKVTATLTRAINPTTVPNFTPL